MPLTRRTALQGTAVVAAVAAPTTVWLMGRDRPVAFTLDHDPDFQVWIGNGDRFRLEVRRDGRVLEAFDDLDADALLSLRSEHLRVRETPVPAPSR